MSKTSLPTSFKMPLCRALICVSRKNNNISVVELESKILMLPYSGAKLVEPGQSLAKVKAHITLISLLRQDLGTYFPREGLNVTT